MTTKLDKVCEIVFNKLRIPIYDREGGKYTVSVESGQN